MVKVFLDTNIVMDFLEKERNRHLISSAIIRECLLGNIKGCISETVVTNCSYLLRKTYSQNQLNEIFSNFSIYFKFLGLNNLSIQKACKVNIRDLEDAILYQLAFENSCQYFITTNTKDFISISQPQLKVVTPEEFLEIFTMP